MADGSANVIPQLRLGTPILEDYAYIARHMRSDEVQQFMAITGMKTYSQDACARAMANMRGPSYVYVDRQNMPVLLGGFDPIRKGVYEAWLAGTDEAWSKYWRAFTKISLRMIDGMLKGDAHRIQTTALITRTHAHAWYERLGMKNEGVQKMYCADGQDAIRFAITKGAAT
jgi:hypothetical protein